MKLKVPYKYLIGITFICGLLYRVVCSMQGVDSVDAGFNSTFFQYIYERPDAIIYNYLYYVTGLVGGLWYKMFGGGLLGLRMGELTLVTLTSLMLYRLFRHNLSKPLLAVATAFCFLLPITITTLHYNTLTYFLCTISACFYASFNDKERWWKLFLCGFFLGLAFLVRIVNFSLLALTIVPLIVDYNQTTWKKRLCRTLLMLVGMAFGFGAILCIMQSLGHTRYFLEGVQMAFSTLTDATSSHSSGGITYAYFKGALNILLSIIVLATCAFLLKRDAKQTAGKAKIYYTLAAIAFIVITITNPPHLIFSSFCFFLAIPYLFIKKASWTKEERVSVFLLIAALIIPFGSDIGIAGICHWTPGLLIFPACLAINSKEHKQRNICVAALGFIALYSICKNMLDPYCGDGTRFSQTTMICNKLNVYDSKEGAARYQQAISSIKKYAKDNPYLVLCNHQTELYFATDMIPLLGVTETQCYGGTYLIKRLEERSCYYRRFPVIAIINGIGNKLPETQADVMRFSIEHNYTPVFINQNIKIYTTQDIPTKGMTTK